MVLNCTARNQIRQHCRIVNYVVKSLLELLLVKEKKIAYDVTVLLANKAACQFLENKELLRFKQN